MPGTIRYLRIGLGILLMVGLAACSTFGLGPPAPSSRPLDVLNDDVSSLVLAVDVSSRLRIITEESVIRYDVAVTDGEARHAVAALQYLEADGLPPTLPAPGAERAYFLLELVDEDRAAVQQAQAYARSANAVGTASAVVTVLPGFCAAEPVDSAGETFTIHLSLEGAGALDPLVIGQPLEIHLIESGAEALSDCEDRP